MKGKVVSVCAGVTSLVLGVVIPGVAATREGRRRIGDLSIGPGNGHGDEARSGCASAPAEPACSGSLARPSGCRRTLRTCDSGGRMKRSGEFRPARRRHSRAEDAQAPAGALPGRRLRWRKADVRQATGRHGHVRGDSGRCRVRPRPTLGGFPARGDDHVVSLLVVVLGYGGAVNATNERLPQPPPRCHRPRRRPRTCGRRFRLAA